MQNPISRRTFISNLAIGSTSALAFPYLSQGASHAPTASKLNVACVGIDHMGSYAVKEGLKENLVALCDVDWRPDKAVWEIGTILVEQLILVPDIPGISLWFDYRGAAELLNAVSGTPFDLHVERENGEAVMTPLAIYHPSAGTSYSDSGILRRRVKLEYFRGEMLRIRFSLTNNGSGENNYTFVMLNNVTLAPYSTPQVQLKVGDQNRILVGMSASDDGAYQLE